MVALASGTSTVSADSVPEPQSVIYGKVTNVWESQGYLVTDGDLKWTVRGLDGKPQEFVAQLEPLAEGRFSYRLNIPHEALSAGLSLSQNTIPLAPVAAGFENLTVRVNGAVATIETPDHQLLELAQNNRASTHRIDLQVGFQPEDSDGDGIPDWWEGRFGSDPVIADADIDLDGDGWSNLVEYQRGTDPTFDNRGAESTHRIDLRLSTGDFGGRAPCCGFGQRP